jgi:hypothetical protein
MGINEGIRDSVADVYVQTADIRTGVITYDKLASNTILPEQLSKTIGHIFRASCPALTAASTAFYSFTCTSGVTIVDAVFIITAAGSTGDLTLKTTTGVTMIATFVSTSTVTRYPSTAHATIVAGASLQLANTASKTNDAVGNIVLTYFYT